MIKGGLGDPAKVTRGALENAASIAAMILTTEALITDLPEKNPPRCPLVVPRWITNPLNKNTGRPTSLPVTFLNTIRYNLPNETNPDSQHTRPPGAQRLQALTGS